MAGKKFFKGFTVAICMGLALSAAAGCNGSGKKNEPYTSIANAAADFTAEFTMNVGERPAHPYAESTGRTFYVASNGNDANDGLSESKPIRTLKKVNSLGLKAGDKVLFKGGDTFGDTNIKVLTSGADDNPVYFGSYGEGQGKISTVNGSCFFLNNVGNIVIENLDLMMTTPDRTADGGSFPSVIQGSYTPTGDTIHKNIYILNNKIHGAGFKSGSNGVTFTTVYTYGEDGNLNADKTQGAPDGFITNCYITDNEVYDIGVTGLAVTSWHNDAGPVNGTGTKVTLYKNVHIDRNKIYNIGQIGAYIGSCSYSTLSGNLVYDTAINTDGLVSVGDCGLMTISCDHCEMNNNVVYGTKTAGMTWDGMGIDIDWNCNYTTVEYNHCYNNMGSGIGTMANVNSTVRYNRMENNECYGNQRGQFQASDFTAESPAIADFLKATSSMLVEENLIISNQENAYAVSMWHSNGIPAWEGNRFIGNHVVNDFRTEKPKYVIVDVETVWEEFGNNKYYNNDLVNFSCFDPTKTVNQGAIALPNGYCNAFEEWKARDVGATLEKISKDVPSAPGEITATCEDGKIKLSWKASSGDLWNYNVHLLNDGEEPDYTSMVAKTKECSYEYEVPYKGTYCFVVRPESNQGHYGKAVKVIVTVK